MNFSRSHGRCWHHWSRKHCPTIGGVSMNVATNNHTCLQLSLVKTAKQWYCNPIHRGPITISDIGALGQIMRKIDSVTSVSAKAVIPPLCAPLGFRVWGPPCSCQHNGCFSFSWLTIPIQRSYCTSTFQSTAYVLPTPFSRDHPRTVTP